MRGGARGAAALVTGKEERKAEARRRAGRRRHMRGEGARVWRVRAGSGEEVAGETAAAVGAEAESIN